jgi:hypothetical protein
VPFMAWICSQRPLFENATWRGRYDLHLYYDLHACLQGIENDAPRRAFQTLSIGQGRRLRNVLREHAGGHRRGSYGCNRWPGHPGEDHRLVQVPPAGFNPRTPRLFPTCSLQKGFAG